MFGLLIAFILGELTCLTSSQLVTATCNFTDADKGSHPDISKVEGSLTLTQTVGKTDPLEIKGEVTGLSGKARRGFHVHDHGTFGCESIGLHYNPLRKDHGGPTGENRHLGDLGNINIDRNGKANIYMTDPVLTLLGDNSIYGKSIAIHTEEDDLGNGNNEESKKTGNAGAPIACCVIRFEENAE